VTKKQCLGEMGSEKTQHKGKEEKERESGTRREKEGVTETLLTMIGAKWGGRLMD